MPTTPSSSHLITLPDPTINISGVFSLFSSKTFPSGKVAVYVIETISHTFTLFLLVQPANTKRESDAIARKLIIFFMVLLVIR
jgi:hypothetical protein